MILENSGKHWRPSFLARLFVENAGTASAALSDLDEVRTLLEDSAAGVATNITQDVVEIVPLQPRATPLAPGMMSGPSESDLAIKLLRKPPRAGR